MKREDRIIGNVQFAVPTTTPRIPEGRDDLRMIQGWLYVEERSRYVTERRPHRATACERKRNYLQLAVLALPYTSRGLDVALNALRLFVFPLVPPYTLHRNESSISGISPFAVTRKRFENESCRDDERVDKPQSWKVSRVRYPPLRQGLFVRKMPAEESAFRGSSRLDKGQDNPIGSEIPRERKDTGGKRIIGLPYAFHSSSGEPIIIDNTAQNALTLTVNCYAIAIVWFRSATVT
ncbi:hypothetical protein HZH66_004439 [Vespula vulgaris]|uniref:Uncharacterized protein n=1 Tax=Vespula vulgaris TaxID=7454 RepID=A0A834KF26_VESVU|nr:hypothetical protein HZH66_004439 [Vespula vulgaris]